MKTTVKHILFPFCLSVLMSGSAVAGVSQDVVESISTPDKVETSIGTLEFFDGAPSPETAEKVYDYLDTMRAADTFMKGMPGASLKALIDGFHDAGAEELHEILIFDKLMDSKSLYLTANTSTMYVLLDLDLRRDGPTVIEVPNGLLGAANDAWFRYVNDLMQAGKYLYLPPGYEEAIPQGYTVVRPKTYRLMVFLRANIAEGLDKAASFVKSTVKVYPLSKADNPPEMKFVSGSGKSFNTIHPNTIEFYEHLNEVIQYEAMGMLDPETRGLFASIGIQKGKKFAPDERMKKILADGVAIANAAARSIVWYPRVDFNLAGVRVYPDSDSSWVLPFVDRNVFFNGDDGQTMSDDARVTFYYPYTAVTPAMATPREGTGSDYAMAYVDAEKLPFDGARTYRLHLPPNVPVNNFWAVTIYDSQTRSQLQTSQRFPTVGSQDDGIRQNEDGSYDIYFGPKAPEGYENNWLETLPGKSMIVILRMYGPLKPWLEQTWRPSEVELVE